MTTQELLNFFRGMHADSAQPYYYSDAFLLQLANEAQKEVARRTRCFIDSTAAGICVVAVLANDQSFTRDSRIIFVRDVRLASKSDKLWKISYRDLDLCDPGWLTADAADTTHYVLDYQTGKVYFHSKFLVNDTVRMTVVREPLAPMDLASVDPEIPGRWQEKLAHWMAYRAFNTSDLEDKYDPVKGAAELKFFEAEFGPASTALDEQWIDQKHGYDQFEGLA